LAGPADAVGRANSRAGSTTSAAAAPFAAVARYERCRSATGHRHCHPAEKNRDLSTAGAHFTTIQKAAASLETAYAIVRFPLP